MSPSGITLLPYNVHVGAGWIMSQLPKKVNRVQVLQS